MLEMSLERISQKYGKIKRYWLLRINERNDCFSFLYSGRAGENEYEVIYEIYNLQKIRQT